MNRIHQHNAACVDLIDRLDQALNARVINAATSSEQNAALRLKLDTKRALLAVPARRLAAAVRACLRQLEARDAA